MDLLDRFRIDAENQALRYVVSKVMFCQNSGCGHILDYRKAVEVEFTTGKLFVVCEDCFNNDRIIQHLLEAARSQNIIKKITKYQDWHKLEIAQQKKLAIERQQLKLDLFNSTSKN